jgi:hypothetical protein
VSSTSRDCAQKVFFAGPPQELCDSLVAAHRSAAGLSAKSVHRRRVLFLGAPLKRRYRNQGLERRGAP